MDTRDRGKKINVTNIRSSRWQQKNAGFSLIEILMVLVVAGILVSGATVMFSSGGSEQTTKNTIEKFTTISRYASELAVLGGEPVGLILVPPAWRDNPLDQGWLYRWQKMTMTGWADVEEMPTIDIDKDIELNISIEDRLWKWDKERPEQIVPILVFYPGGDVSPFEIEFTHKYDQEISEHVEVDVWGQVVWREFQEMKEELERGY